MDVICYVTERGFVGTSAIQEESLTAVLDKGSLSDLLYFFAHIEMAEV